MKTLDSSMVLPLFLQQFDTMTTASAGMSVEMKTYYDAELIRMAGPSLVHDQFGQKRPIPKGKGKEVEFRKFDSLSKALTPLVEGVKPKGSEINVSDISCRVHQYGDYIPMSDVLMLTAIDNVLLEAIDILADQAGRTLDTVTREVLSGGTNVQYGSGEVMSRYKLMGGSELPEDNHYMSVLAIKKGVLALKNQNAKRIGKSFVAIVHPNIAFDLTNDAEWKWPHQYVDTQNLYEGEIGSVQGCRFAETTEAKVFYAPDLATDSRTLTLSAAASSATISFDGGTVGANALVGRSILVDTQRYKVVSNTATTMTLDRSVTATSGTLVYAGEAGAQGREVYATLMLGANAYGITDIDGGGLSSIVKQLGSGGTADPLNQLATAGWKSIKGAIRLVEQYMVRIETCASTELGMSN